MPVPLADSETLLEGLNAWQVRPDGTLSVRETDPAKLYLLVSVTVDVSEEPSPPLGEVAPMEKSPT